MYEYPSKSSSSPVSAFKRVVLPAPLGPTTAILDSSPTSIVTLEMIVFPYTYPIFASFNLNRGGPNFESGFGNINTQVGSSAISSIISNFFKVLIFDYTSEALFALTLNLSMNS